MAKQKSLEQLRAEKEQVEKRLAQEQHKLFGSGKNSHYGPGKISQM